MTFSCCNTCRFWQAYCGEGSPVRYGACRRRAPVPADRPLLNMDAIHAWWPTTDADDWCGEFEPRPVAELEEPASS